MYSSINNQGILKMSALLLSKFNPFLMDKFYFYNHIQYNLLPY